jgi:hypothetical protein
MVVYERAWAIGFYESVLAGDFKEKYLAHEAILDRQIAISQTAFAGLFTQG